MKIGIIGSGIVGQVLAAGFLKHGHQAMLGTRDPQKPTWFNPAYDSGDHLHPGDAGYKAMGDSIDLSLFRK